MASNYRTSDPEILDDPLLRQTPERGMRSSSSGMGSGLPGISVLDEDRDLFKSMVETKYKPRIDEITRALQADPTKYKAYEGEIAALTTEMKEDLAYGDLGIFTQRKRDYDQLKDNIMKNVKDPYVASEYIKNITVEPFKNEEGRYGKVQIDKEVVTMPESADWNKFIANATELAAPKLKQTITQTLASNPYQSEMMYGNLLETTQKEAVNAVISAMNPKWVQAFQRHSNVLGMGTDESKYRNEDGTLNLDTLLGRQIQTMSESLARQQLDNIKTFTIKDEGKIAKVKGDQAARVKSISSGKGKREWNGELEKRVKSIIGGDVGLLVNTKIGSNTIQNALMEGGKIVVEMKSSDPILGDLKPPTKIILDPSSKTDVQKIRQMVLSGKEFEQFAKDVGASSEEGMGADILDESIYD